MSDRSQDSGRSAAFANLTSRWGLVLAWAFVIVLFCVLQPDTFMTIATFQTIFGTQSILMILTLALLVSLAAGEFDLSVAGVMSIALVLVGWLNVEQGWPVGLAVLAALAAGVLIGLVNAFVVIVIGVDSIIVTLGTGTLLTGLGVAILPSATTGVSHGLVDLVQTQLFGLPLSFFYGVLLTAILWYVSTLTPLGRRMYFVGANREVARLSGLRVNRLRAGAFVGASLLSAAAGVIYAGTLSGADPSVSAVFLLPAFAAAYLGATAVTPGRFNAWGSLIAVYFLVTGITGLELSGLSGWVEDVFYGGALVCAVALSRLAGRKPARRLAGSTN
jgi:ribose transport system permease protein